MSRLVAAFHLKTVFSKVFIAREYELKNTTEVRKEIDAEIFVESPFWKCKIHHNFPYLHVSLQYSQTKGHT